MLSPPSWLPLTSNDSGSFQTQVTRSRDVRSFEGVDGFLRRQRTARVGQGSQRFTRWHSWICVALLLCASPAFAKKTVILAGGGCEDPRRSNQFRDNFEQSVQAYRRMGWEVVVLYDRGGQVGGGPARPFEVQEFERTVRSTLAGSGGGDEVMLQIMTHGSRGDHGYCFHESLDGSGIYPARKLSSLIQEELARKGRARPQLAVYDQSCFGGGSLDVLGSENVCVVSSAGRKTPNVDGNLFDSYFPAQFERGRSIEEAFLRSLPFSADASAPNPQISSNLSETIQGLDRFVSRVTEHSKRLGPTSGIDYREFARSFLSPSDCSRQHALYSELAGEVTKYRAIISALPGQSPHRANALRGLEESLQIYHRLIFDQNELRRVSSETPLSCHHPSDPKVCARLRALGWDPIYPEGYALLQGSSPEVRELRALWEQVVNAPGNEALKAQLSDYLQRRDALQTLGMDLMIRFDWIRPALRDLYDRYYSESADHASSPGDRAKVSACRRFRF